MSASLDPGSGWGDRTHMPDPCTTLAHDQELAAGKRLGVLFEHGGEVVDLGL
jgi:hypothetical protein